MAEEHTFRELIRRVRAGEEQAAAELVRRYEPAIRRAVRVRLRGPHLRCLLDSMDVCQSVLLNFFVRAAAGQFELDTPEQVLKLLATMARHRLAPDERRLLELREQGREWAEIAAEVGGSPEALRKKLARAVGRVARELGLEEVSHE
jgi:RNA polymerase sigma-70 factor (ECF subfamily)